MEITYKCIHTITREVERATLKSLDGCYLHAFIVLLDFTAYFATSFNYFSKQTLHVMTLRWK